MTRPHGILRAGYPYLRTLGMRRITNFPVDVAFGKDNMIYVLCRAEGQALIRVWPIEDMEQQTDDLKGIGTIKKLILQFLLVLLILYVFNGGPLNMIERLSGWPSWVISSFLLVWLINVYNFIGSYRQFQIKIIIYLHFRNL